MIIVIIIAEEEYPVHQKLYFTSISDQMSLLKRKFYFTQRVPGTVLWLAAENTVGVLCYLLLHITLDEKHYMVHIFENSIQSGIKMSLPQLLTLYCSRGKSESVTF